MARTLVVDDDRAIRITLERLLRGEGYDVTAVADGHDAVEEIAVRGGVDVVLLDLGLPRLPGLCVLEKIKDLENAPAVIVLTAREDMQSTVRAVQLGAHDYLVKPFEIDRLKLIVRRALQARAAARNAQAVASVAAREHEPVEIVGRSPAIRDLYKTIGAVSTSRAAVLVLGESGTGKELVAKAVHYSSNDRDKPFVAVNCTALSRELYESELFGHVRGAFTGAVSDKVGRFELAGEGSLFLDEIADIPLDLQPKLLRVLQERSFERVGDARSIPLRARVIAATHRNLEEMVRTGAFREDLYYRLKVFEIFLPPLRERMEDLPLLIEKCLQRLNLELHKRVACVSPEALQLMQNYAWPGNVRELENALTRAMVLCKGAVLEADLLPPLGARCSAPPRPATAEPKIASLREMERQHIAQVLAQSGWNKRRACSSLEISRPTLDRKIEEYAIVREDS
jgi:two-component system, NtrC family, response regulator AtoC